MNSSANFDVEVLISAKTSLQMLTFWIFGYFMYLQQPSKYFERERKQGLFQLV
jgi:hypothetical protein